MGVVLHQSGAAHGHSHFGAGAGPPADEGDADGNYAECDADANGHAVGLPAISVPYDASSRHGHCDREPSGPTNLKRPEAHSDGYSELGTDDDHEFAAAEAEIERQARLNRWGAPPAAAACDPHVAHKHSHSNSVASTQPPSANAAASDPSRNRAVSAVLISLDSPGTAPAAPTNQEPVAVTGSAGDEEFERNSYSSGPSAQIVNNPATRSLAQMAESGSGAPRTTPSRVSQPPTELPIALTVQPSATSLPGSSINGSFSPSSSTGSGACATGAGFGAGHEAIERNSHATLSGQHSHAHSHHRHNVNVRAAFIHVIGDFIQSIGVLIASVLVFINVRLSGIYFV